jgi:molecular chaperone HscB
MDYFKLFGLSPQLELDTKALKKKYYQLSKEAHPDHFTQDDAATQEKQLDASSQVNEAYKTLKNEESRIQYILMEKGLLGDNDQKVPQTFLMEMMEINEALMDLEMGGDEAEYESAMRRVKEFESALLTQLEEIKKGWTEEPDMDSLEALKDYYLKNRYLLRMKENLSKFADR